MHGDATAVASFPAVAEWCLLQLIKALEEARGNGTSMISLIMQPKDQV